jgi:hypothetical protein
MGTTWHSMWYRLVLAYQQVVQRSCDGRTDAMFGEAAMAGTQKAQVGLLGGCDAHTGGETSVGTLQAR